jgi:hypothetical protein
MFSPVSAVDLFYHLILVVYLAIFLYLHANHIWRSLAAVMADTARPQTPTRKLFKPSNKTKTTPVRRFHESTPSSPESTHSAPKAAITSDTAGPKKKSFRSTSNKLVRRVSQASSTHSRPALDDITKSTRLAPLTSRNVAESVTSDYAASDTTGDTPIGLIDNDDLTPTDTVSRSTDAARDFPRTSDSLTGAVGRVPDRDSTAVVPDKAPDPQSETPTNATQDLPQDTPDEHVALDEISEDTGAVENLASNPINPESVKPSELAEESTSTPDEPEEPIDIVKYFADQGHPELSEFVKALTAPPDPVSMAKTAMQSVTDTGRGIMDKARGASGDHTKASPNPLKELPTDDDLVVDPSSKADDAAAEATPKASDVQEEADDVASGAKTEDLGVESDLTHQTPDVQETAEDTVGDKVGVPDTSSITKGQDVVGDATGKPLDVGQTLEDANTETTEKVSNLTDAPTAQMNGAAKRQPSEISSDPILSRTASPVKSPGDVRKTGTKRSPTTAYGAFDNMGKPARVKRSMEIPIPRPQRPQPSSGMRIPEVDALPSTDNLASLHDLEDPPEVFLDPTMEELPTPEPVVISPIPKIPKVTPISSKIPPDLARLAKGLGGNTVDDVGNIVDESGKVLGHATGDLPSMIGKKISDNGEVYGDEGELIGFVTENFTEHAPEKETPQSPAEQPATPMPLPGGLSVDTDGNILDSAGNIIGRLNNKPSQSGPLIPLDEGFKSTPKTETKSEQGDEDKSEDKKNAIPADIFLDVKSTPDGIQLTIRIPTVFKQEHRQS